MRPSPATTRRRACSSRPARPAADRRTPPHPSTRPRPRLRRRPPSSVAVDDRLRPSGEPVLGATVDRVDRHRPRGALGPGVPARRLGSRQRARQRPDQARGTDGDVADVGKVDGVDGDGEGGLLGIALSPSYESDHLLFAYYTRGDENVIARITYDDAHLSGQRVVFDGIPSGGIHNGGRLAFGPDGYLYVGTGDAGRGSPAQDKGDLGGKILRITPDGEPAPGNPFGGSPVWSYGHRNVQGLAFDESGPAVGGGVRPEHVGRAEPHREGRQLRLARRRGTRRSRGLRRPGAPVAHRRRLTERHRDRGQRGLHGSAARRAAVADPHPGRQGGQAEGAAQREVRAAAHRRRRAGRLAVADHVEPRRSWQPRARPTTGSSG